MARYQKGRNSSNYRGNNRSGSGYNKGGGRYGNNNRNGRYSRGRQSVESGNQRERISIESGELVLIDQFMLANPQFNEQLLNMIDDDPSTKDDLIKEYGGTVVDLAPGTYRIERDPYSLTIVIHPEGEKPEMETLSEDASKARGHVFIDTRCLAMIDKELLDDSSLLDKYNQLWFSGQDKACRDLLRDNGGAVRYGFQRFGDELGVYSVPDMDVVCLWPDVAEGAQNTTEE